MENQAQTDSVPDIKVGSFADLMPDYGIDTLPEVSPAIDAMESQPKPIATASPAASKPSSQLDIAGTAFDPDLHEVDKDGKPLKRVNGQFKKRRGNGGRIRRESKLGTTDQATAQPAAKLRLPDPETGAVSDAERLAAMRAQQQRSLAALHAEAEGFVQTGFMMGQMWLGDEWKPDEGEVENLTPTVARFMQHNDIQELSPNMALVIAVCCVGAKRINKPKTKGIIGRLGNWVKAAWYARKARRDVRDDKPEAPESTDARKQGMHA